MAECPVPPMGWRCTRKAGHPPPCAALPRRWNLLARLDRQVQRFEDRWLKHG